MSLIANVKTTLYLHCEKKMKKKCTFLLWSQATDSSLGQIKLLLSSNPFNYSIILFAAQPATEKLKLNYRCQNQLWEERQ